MQTRFTLLCDHAFVTSDNKLSIIGEFDSLMVPGKGTVPTLTQAFVVASFEGAGKGKHKVLVKFVTHNNAEEFLPEKELSFHAEESGRANVLLKLVNMHFPSVGRYFIKFFDEKGKLLSQTKLDVSVLPSVIRE